MRCGSRHRQLDSFPILCWLRGKLSVDDRSRLHCGHVCSREARKRNGGMGYWSSHRPCHRPCWYVVLYREVQSCTNFETAGGYLAQAKGWRWTFWILAMAVRSDIPRLMFRLLTHNSTERCRSYQFIPHSPRIICAHSSRPQNEEIAKGDWKHELTLCS